MLSSDKKKELLEELLSSNTFKKATTSSALLQYLLKAHLNNAFLKENIIDIDFFGKKGDEERSNTRVRVSMYNLRKKLDVYYTSEGKQASYKLCIDKGQYGLRFEKQQKQGKRQKRGFNIKQHYPFLIIGLLIILLIISQVPKRKPPIWEHFIESNTPTTLYVGDVFGFRGKTISGKDGWTRNYSINSIQEYYALVEQNPELRDITRPSPYNYTTGMGVHAAHRITKLLTPYHKNLKIAFTTESKLKDIKKGNGIYAGSLYNNNNFIPLFNAHNPYFTISRNALVYNNNDSTESQTFSFRATGNEKDYAVVSFLPGPNETHQLMFFSNHNMGVEAVINQFTNPDSLSSFSKKHLKIKDHFTALYLAKGINRTSLELETLMVVPHD